MVDHPPFNADSDLSKFSIPTVFTKPNVIIHGIEDGELESIAQTALSRPQVVFCAASGYILGDLRNIWPIFESYIESNNAYSLGDLIFFGIFVSAIILFCVSGTMSFNSKSKNTKKLKEIRARKATEVNN